MRRRSTFVHDPSLQFDPAEIKVTANRLSFAGLKAAREERIIYGFKELPAELVDVLQQSHEIHIKWQSERGYASQSPFVSSLIPGLHVQYTPLQSSQDSDLMCPLLQKAFSATLKCHSVGATFTTPHLVSERFASAASNQLYSPLSSLAHLVTYLQRDICSRSDVTCLHTVALLNVADYVDIDYDTISHTLTVTVYWSKPPAVLFDPVGEWTTYDHWNLAVDAASNDKNEVGILTGSPASDLHELQLEGFLTVVGQDEEPSPTLFSFPSRHHLLSSEQLLSQTYSVSFQKPTGLHPTLSISFPNAQLLNRPDNKPPSSTCTLHAYFTLPSVIFADEYAFGSDDRLFYEAHNLRSLRAISGELDLEAPDYVVDKWGSSILLELATPTDVKVSPVSGVWNVTVPLHLRYLEPERGGFAQTDIPWPIVFWACTAEEGTKFTVNPFDRINLGYDGLFGSRTMFYHLRPDPGTEGTKRLVETIQVPVIDTTQVSNEVVDLGTVAVIVLGFIWILVKLWPGLKREIFGEKDRVVKATPAKKKQ